MNKVVSEAHCSQQEGAPATQNEMGAPALFPASKPRKLPAGNADRELIREG